MDNYDYELDESELSPSKPYTPERAAEIAELMSDIAQSVNDLFNMD